MKGRTPQGVRGLKSMACRELQHDLSRTPQGVRGLKSDVRECDLPEAVVAPRKGCVD